MRRISSLWRSVVPWHPATAWALAASVIVFVSTWISHGFHSGVRGGLVAFLAWAIVRELAPRRAAASALAPFAAVAYAIPAESDVLSCVVVLLAARIASRTVGAPPTWLDLGGLLALVLLAAQRDVGLPVTLVLAAALFGERRPVRSRVAGVALLVAALAVGSIEGTLTPTFGWDDPVTAEQVLLGITAAAAALLAATRLPARMRARDDRFRAPLSGSRVRHARVVVLASVLATVAWTGIDGAFALSAASAALLAAGLGGRRARAAEPATAR